MFFRIWTEYGEIRSISPYSLRMREKKDQNNSEYGHFSRSAGVLYKIGVLKNLAKFIEKHLCQSLFFNKVTGVSPALMENKYWFF